jgi:hypothetical protein
MALLVPLVAAFIKFSLFGKVLVDVCKNGADEVL